MLDGQVDHVSRPIICWIKPHFWLVYLYSVYLLIIKAWSNDRIQLLPAISCRMAQGCSVASLLNCADNSGAKNLYIFAVGWPNPKTTRKS